MILFHFTSQGYFLSSSSSTPLHPSSPECLWLPFGCPDYEVPLSKNCRKKTLVILSVNCCLWYACTCVRVCLVKYSTFIAIHSFHPCISTDEKIFLRFSWINQFNEADQRVQCACLSLMFIKTTISLDF